MRRILFFMMTSLDGYFEGPDHDINWHRVDEEFNDFAIEQLDSVDALLFGRMTYQMMASYWPTPAATEDDPVVAGKMNSLPKIVFSTTLPDADWQNTRLVKENVAAELSKLKEQPGKDLIIFGSSDLAVTLIRDGLLDEIRVMVNPVVLGGGKLLFEGLKGKLNLTLLKTRVFRNGNVLFFYRPDYQ